MPDENGSSSTYPKRKHAIGYEWTNQRGQVFIYLPDSPMARKDGFLPRSKLVMSLLIERDILPLERVWHKDENPNNDDPTNLVLFPNQAALNAHRTAIFHASKSQALKDKLSGLTERARDARRDYLLEQDFRADLARRTAWCHVCNRTGKRKDERSSSLKPEYTDEPCPACNGTKRLNALVAHDMQSLEEAT